MNLECFTGGEKRCMYIGIAHFLDAYACIYHCCQWNER